MLPTILKGNQMAYVLPHHGPESSEFNDINQEELVICLCECLLNQTTDFVSSVPECVGQVNEMLCPKIHDMKEIHENPNWKDHHSRSQEHRHHRQCQAVLLVDIIGLSSVRL
ncbi:uncharacterized protein LOC130773436 isoform X2 [Actinidia eriantha]|uniref:uncharacterized protein LOC130773436 isoform X2 n=1 Tax=Actinidia eriantha TaxID=165200 RepID=UPI00258EF78A|nr:uncharacterized protein LOC130773436 isoform X2 [Actinidia eriantha]